MQDPPTGIAIRFLRQFDAPAAARMTDDEIAPMRAAATLAETLAGATWEQIAEWYLRPALAYLQQQELDRWKRITATTPPDPAAPGAF